jgi:PEP-CTERM motif
MRKLYVFSVVSFLALSVAVATADPFVGSITFEGLSNGEAVGNFYQSQGITFTGFYAVAGHFWMCVDTPVTCSAIVHYGAVMNVQPGFQKGLSFYFNQGGSGEVLLYDGLDGQGTMLADVPLWPAISEWEPFGFTFGGLAKSAVFNGEMEVAFVTMGGAMVLPEPATVALLLSGLATIVGFRRRKR